MAELVEAVADLGPVYPRRRDAAWVLDAKPRQSQPFKSVAGQPLTLVGRSRRLHPNQSIYIPLGAVHRLANPGEQPLHVIEVQSGDHLGEDDIERYEDVYGRS